jgi:hypothetical protein
MARDHALQFPAMAMAPAAVNGIAIGADVLPQIRQGIEWRPAHQNMGRVSGGARGCDQIGYGLYMDRQGG